MEFRLRGLDGPVEIVRDRSGVPHCWALTEHDAFFAQGFVHAADRLWQLDYDRRRGLGRSAEVVGAAGVTWDSLSRRLDLAGGARRDLARLSAPARDMLTAYTAGVNALIGRQRETGHAETGLAAGGLPAEFALSGHEPEPWEPWHCLLVYRVRHLTMGSAAGKLWRGVVSQALGPAAARAMASGLAGWQLACVPPGEQCEGAVPAWAGLDDGGSNNWALAGSAPLPGCRSWPETRTGRWRCRTSTSRGTSPDRRSTCWGSQSPEFPASRTSVTTTGSHGASPMRWPTTRTCTTSRPGAPLARLTPSSSQCAAATRCRWRFGRPIGARSLPRTSRWPGQPRPSPTLASTCCRPCCGRGP